MAQIPQPVSLNVEAFGDLEPESRRVLEKLAFILNPYFSDANAALDRGLTFGENFRGQVREIEFTAPASGGLPGVFTLDRTFPGTPSGVIALSAKDITDSKALAPKAGVSVAISPTSQDGAPAFTVADVAGCVSGRRYRLKLLVFPEN